MVGLSLDKLDSKVVKFLVAPPNMTDDKGGCSSPLSTPVATPMDMNTSVLDKL